MAVTASTLRADIYKILDGILETGEPVEIERKGRILRIVTDEPRGPKSSRIVYRPDWIHGDPLDFTHIDWSGEWSRISDLP